MSYYCLKNILDTNNTVSNKKHNISYTNIFSFKPKQELDNYDMNSINDIINISDLDIPNIDGNILKEIKEPLKKLSNFVGLESIKNNIIDQILYYSQNLHNEDDYLHTVICGPPGTGKTELSKIIGEIFSNLGILKNKTFKKVTRSDLIAGFLGQTAIKTKAVVEECLGGVLFIDEVYALGNSEKSDSFSKECIDTLCEALSNHKNQLMVIVAGYENDIENCFFAYNKGLKSRFIWKYKIEKYTAEELFSILQKNIKAQKWTLDDSVSSEWFNDKMDYFKYYGRDVEQLFSKIKISHARRIFGKLNIAKKHIINDDVEAAFKKLKLNVKDIGDNESYLKMYT